MSKPPTTSRTMIIVCSIFYVGVLVASLYFLTQPNPDLIFVAFGVICGVIGLMTMARSAGND